MPASSSSYDMPSANSADSLLGDLESSLGFTFDKALLRCTKFTRVLASGETVECFLLCTPMAKLHWSTEPMHEQDPLPSETNVELSNIQGIQLGKTTAGFLNDAMADTPKQVCFSVVTPLETLNLVAESSEVRDVWAGNLYETVTAIRSPPPQSRSLAVRPVERNEPPMTREQLPSAEEVKRIKEFLHAGKVLIKHGRRGKPKKRWINAGNGRIFWASATSGGTATTMPTSQSISLLKVLEMKLGKQTTVLHRSSAVSAPPEHCFSLITDERTLDLECESEEERAQWVNAIGQAVRLAKVATHSSWLESRRLESAKIRLESDDEALSVVHETPAPVPRLRKSVSARRAPVAEDDDEDADEDAEEEDDGETGEAVQLMTGAAEPRKKRKKDKKRRHRKTQSAVSPNSAANAIYNAESMMLNVSRRAEFHARQDDNPPPPPPPADDDLPPPPPPPAGAEPAEYMSRSEQKAQRRALRQIKREQKALRRRKRAESKDAPPPPPETQGE